MSSRLTSSPWGFRLFPFGDFCRIMKKNGITEVCSMFGDPQKLAINIAPTKAAAVEARKAAADAGVKVLEVSVSSQAYVEQLPLAAELGARFVRFCEIWPTDAEAKRRLRQILTAAGDQAQQLGLTVIVENHGGSLTTAAQCRELFVDVGRPNVKLNYDPANYFYYGDHPWKTLDLVAEFIGFTHFKSVRVDVGKASYCRLRDGLLDYEFILRELLVKHKYAGPLGLEYEFTDDAEQGMLDDLASLRRELSGLGLTGLI